jgi:ACS family hexuronate transporter-like MFS transporter
MTVGVLAPLIKPDLQLTTAEVGLLSSASTIGSMLSQIPAGMLSGALGAKWIMVLGLVLVAVSSFAISLLNSYAALFLFLILQGIGIGCNQSPASKAIVMWFALKGRATAMGIKQMGITIGGVLASFCLPLIAIHYGNWRYAFKGTCIAALVPAAILLLLYVDPPKQSSGQPESSPAWKENLKRIISGRNFRLMGAAGICLMAAQFAFSTHFVLYATKILQFPAGEGGILLGVSFLTAAAGRIGWNLLSDFPF